MSETGLEFIVEAVTALRVFSVPYRRHDALWIQGFRGLRALTASWLENVAFSPRHAHVRNILWGESETD